MKRFFWGSWVVFGLMLFAWWYGPAVYSLTADQPIPAIASTESVSDEVVPLILFGRDTCGYCKEQFAWLKTTDLQYTYLNVEKDPEAARLFTELTEKHDLTKVTPITVAGERVIVGFNGPDTTGKALREAYEAAQGGDIRTIEEHLARAPQQSGLAGAGCTDVSCSAEGGSFVFDLPVIGIVDLQSFSLFTLSALLGVIDGFNPCAMWVLITFCVLLSQAGSRRKMIFLAGLFMVAEGIMYNLILNVWYKAWDWVALDAIVTPLVGFLALGGGAFFLWRWYKNRDAALVCDVTDLETQGKVISRFKAIANQPITIVSVVSIIAIAFSVNVIEFACSIGIPQAYTKILELNMLTFLERQFYIMVYTLGYMFDDVVVFGLAIWGYSRLQAMGGKYAHLSLLIGGLLMLVLGALLVIDPTMLVW